MSVFCPPSSVPPYERTRTNSALLLTALEACSICWMRHHDMTCHATAIASETSSNRQVHIMWHIQNCYRKQSHTNTGVLSFPSSRFQKQKPYQTPSVKFKVQDRFQGSTSLTKKSTTCPIIILLSLWFMNQTSKLYLINLPLSRRKGGE